MTTIIKKKTICPLDCPDSCGMVATMSDGKITGLAGDKEHPYTNGFICRKMRRYPERFYGKERILYPQLRTGEKGAGQFKRASWDEALDVVAAKLKEVSEEYGGEAILPYSYAGNMGLVSRSAGYPLFNKLGASRLDQTICSAAAGAGWKYQCTTLPGSPPENASGSELIVAWGINIKVTNVHFWQYVTEARKNGGRLIVIDPYCNQTGKSADTYLPIRPGGDSSLAIGLAKYIIEEELLEDIPGQGCHGYGAWKDHLHEVKWDHIVRQSGIAQEHIENLARLLADHPKTFIRIGIGLSRNSRGGMSVRAISALGALLGLFRGGEGRGILLSAGAFKGDNAKLNFPELAAQQTRLVNMIHLGHALNGLKPSVKALFVYNSNPLSVNPDGSQVRRGLERKDLFTVVHEQVMTPTARYADVLLPATTFLENQDVYTAYGHFYMGVTQPVLSSLGEARSNFDLFQDLAKRMGFDDPPFLQSCEERLSGYLDSLEGVPEGFNKEALFAGDYLLSEKWCSKRSNENWQSQFSFSNDTDYLLSKLPSMTPAGEFDDPDLLARFSLQLLTPPHPDLLNSTFGERFADYLGELLIHPVDAVHAGVGEGDRVVIENLRGRTERVARITEDTQQGIVVAEGIFWANTRTLRAVEPFGGINDLTSQKLTDMGGGATFHESLVRVFKA